MRRRRHLGFGQVLERAGRAAAGGRAAAVAFDEIGADRSAHHAAGDDADHRRGHRERRRAGHAGLFEERRKRQAGRGAAGQRHRSGEHAHQRMLSERPRDGDADDVLQRGDDERDDEEQEDQRTAALQQREAGRKANRREERVLQRHLQRRVELERLEPLKYRIARIAGDRQAAAHRRGNVDPRQDRNQAPQSVTKKQDDAGEGDGLDQIECDRHARDSIRCVQVHSVP